jgi:hypothetical protein
MSLYRNRRRRHRWRARSGIFETFAAQALRRVDEPRTRKNGEPQASSSPPSSSPPFATTTRRPTIFGTARGCCWRRASA